MRIAVASDDGENIAAHFGRCRSFVIFEAERKASGSPQLIPNPIPPQPTSTLMASSIIPTTMKGYLLSSPATTWSSAEEWDDEW